MGREWKDRWKEKAGQGRNALAERQALDGVKKK